MNIGNARTWARCNNAFLNVMLSPSEETSWCLSAKEYAVSHCYSQCFKCLCIIGVFWNFMNILWTAACTLLKSTLSAVMLICAVSLNRVFCAQCGLSFTGHTTGVQQSPPILFFSTRTTFAPNCAAVRAAVSANSPYYSNVKLIMRIHSKSIIRYSYSNGAAFYSAHQHSRYWSISWSSSVHNTKSTKISSAVKFAGYLLQFAA